MRLPQASDINAKGAFNGTSWVPERREEQAVTDYIQHMQAVREMFEPWRTPENNVALDADLEDYRARYAALFNAYLAAHSRVVSQFITGAGGWKASTVRRNEKRGNTADKRSQELREFSDKQLPRLRRRYDPVAIANAPIRSGDPDAIERLEDKIARAEEWQATMREVNRVIRSTKSLHLEEQVIALMEIPGITEGVARELLKPDWAKRIGFADYQLSNNSANIRRMKARLEELSQKKLEQAALTEDVTRDIGEGITYTENRELDRVQIVFSGKPTEAVRELLKSHGFRWAPSQGAWQRHLNAAGRYAAEAVLKEIVPHKKGDTNMVQ